MMDSCIVALYVQSIGTGIGNSIGTGTGIDTNRSHSSIDIHLYSHLYTPEKYQNITRTVDREGRNCLRLGINQSINQL